jgi:hypothetical protein
MAKRDRDSASTVTAGPLTGHVVASLGPLVYHEDAGGSYYLTNPTLKAIVENAGGRFQSGPANSMTTIAVRGDTSKEWQNGTDTWTGSSKQTAVDAELKLSAKRGRKKELSDMPFRQFVSAFELEDDVEPELLWAFTHNNVPVRSQADEEASVHDATTP